MTQPYPTEAEEQITFVNWLRLKKIDHWRTPNETFTRSWKQKTMNKALGVQAGIPDLFVIVNNKLIAIEMKRVKNSNTSPAQLYWIGKLNTAGIPTKVCKGAEEAIKFVEENMV